MSPAWLAYISDLESPVLPEGNSGTDHGLRVEDMLHVTEYGPANPEDPNDDKRIFLITGLLVG